MDTLSSRFLLLAAPNGAFAIMLSSMETIRTILRSAKLTPDEEKIYGHCGIPGEYIHGVDLARMLFERLRDDTMESGLHACISQLFESRTKPSQLSSQLEQTGIHGLKENSFDALFRAINTAQCLLDEKDARLTEADKTLLRGAIDNFTRGLNTVKTFMEENGQTDTQTIAHIGPNIAPKPALH